MEANREVFIAPLKHPDRAELRMLAALSEATMREAVLLGEQHVRFRAFRLDARRLPLGRQGRAVVEMTIDSGDGEPVVLRAELPAQTDRHRINGG